MDAHTTLGLINLAEDAHALRRVVIDGKGYSKGYNVPITTDDVPAVRARRLRA